MLDYKIEFDGKDPEGVVGEVLVRVPSMKERLVLMKEAGIQKADEMGMDTIIFMMDKVSLFVKSLSIKCGDIECSDIDTLSHYDFGMAVFNKVSAILMGGIPTGKK